MRDTRHHAAERLFDSGFINQRQLADIAEYRARKAFSLHQELQTLLYVSILCFASGAGIVIYQNIDSIGHAALLSLLFLVCVGCYCVCFKKSAGYSNDETDFDHPAYNYLVLLATLLGCTFVGYLQYQYRPFGDHFGLAAFLSALIALGSAYYFDNRNALTIGLTSLAAAIGITATPKALIDQSAFGNPDLCGYGIALGVLLVIWADYSQSIRLKKHFAPVLLIFAQQLASICAIIGLFGNFWPVYLACLALICAYALRKSYAMQATTLFVFALIYGYVGLNVLIFKIFDWIELSFFFTLITLLTPVYFIGSIVLFIRAIRAFNKKNDARTC